jgi:hypothetical protein
MILAQTLEWREMSDQGQEYALKVDLQPEVRRLFEQGLTETHDNK